MTRRPTHLSFLAPLALALLAPPGARPAAPPRPRTDLHGDPLPPGAVARLGSVRFRKVWGMNGLTFSPDGRLLGSTNEARLFLWDAASGRLVRTLGEGHRPEIAFSCYAFSPDGRRVVSAAVLGEWLYTWDVATGRMLRRQEGPGESVDLLAFAPDGRTVAGACRGGAVGLWDLNGEKCWRTIPAAGDSVDALAFTPDGKRLACLARQERSVRLLELEAGTGRARRRFALGEVHVIALAPDARAVATFDEERGLRLWDVASGKSRRLLKLTEGDFDQVSFSPNSRTLMAVDFEKQEVQFWDVTTGKRLRRVRLRGLREDEEILLSPDGKTLLCADSQSTVRRWDARTGRPLPTPAGHLGPPERLAFSADGRTLTSLSTEGHPELYRWETATGRLLSRATPGGDLWGSDHWRLSPGGRWAAGAWGRTVRLFDTRTGKRVQELKGHAADVVGLGFSGDGKVLATAGKDRVVRLWDVESGKPLRTLDARKLAKRLNALALSHDGRTVAAGEVPLRLHLWDAATGRHRHTLRGDPKRWEDADVGGEDEWCEGCSSPDARTLYVSIDARVQVWDLAGKREETPFEPPAEAELPSGPCGPESGVGAVSPDGRLLAWVTLGLGLWETASGKTVYPFDGCWSSVAFSPDGRTLATGSAEDGSVLLWDVKELFRAHAPPGAGRPPPATLWQHLADPDAARAYRALLQLADDPGAVGFLARRLRPVRRADPAALAALVRDLGSADYATRQKAESALARMGDAARPALAEAQKKGAALEARLRAGRLLRRLDARSGEPLREARAVQALEYLGTAEARRLLRDLARGIPEARLTQEARSALARMERHLPAR